MQEQLIQKVGASTARQVQVTSPDLIASRKPHGLADLLHDTCSLLATSGSKVWYFYDPALGVLAAFLGFALSPSFTFSPGLRPSPNVVIPAFGFALVLAGVVSGLHERKCFESRFALLIGAMSTVVLSWAAVLAASYALFFSPIGRWVVAISSLAALLGLAVPRLLVSAGAHRVRRVLLLGDGEGLSAVRLLLAHDGGPFELTEPAAIQRPLPSAKEGDVSANEWGSLLDVCRCARADVVVVQNGDRSGTSPSADDIMQCLSGGLEVVDALTFVEKYFHKVVVKSTGVSWLVSAHLHVCRPALVALKRAFDVAAALVGLGMTLPFWPIIGLLIKLTSKGPVLYRQTRIGLFGKPFTIYKFRTMEADAEKAGQPQWAVPGDPRVTPLGRILRRTRIDEIPQFWNILKGNMSLIGPRPERPEFVADFTREMLGYQWRHLVRPGVTGWAQINYRYGSSEEDGWEKLSYDLYYVKNFSPALDAYIFLRTVGAFLHGSR